MKQWTYIGYQYYTTYICIPTLNWYKVKKGRYTKGAQKMTLRVKPSGLIRIKI